MSWNVEPRCAALRILQGDDSLDEWRRVRNVRQSGRRGGPDDEKTLADSPTFPLVYMEGGLFGGLDTIKQALAVKSRAWWNKVRLAE